MHVNARLLSLTTCQVPGRPHMKNNIKDALAPVLHPAGVDGPLIHWAPADVTKIPLPNDCGGALFLLPGHESIVDYEETLSVAYGSRLSLEAGAPGAWNKLIALTARKCGADIVLVDCNPQRGKLNMQIILTSDYLFLPCTPDMFSHNAIKALPSIMEAWVTKRRKALNSDEHAMLPPDLKIPAGVPRILGASVLRFTHKQNKPAKNFRYWMDKIQERLRITSGEMHAIPALAGMAGTPGQPNTWPSILVKMSDFNQLAALSHYYGLPVIALGPDLMGAWNDTAERMVPYTGDRQSGMITSVLSFQRTFQNVMKAIGSKVVDGPFLVDLEDTANTSEEEKEHKEEGEETGEQQEEEQAIRPSVTGLQALTWNQFHGMVTTAGTGGTRVYLLDKFVTTSGRRINTVTPQEAVEICVECSMSVGANDAEIPPAPANILETEMDEVGVKRALLEEMIPFLWGKPEYGGMYMTTTGLVVLPTLGAGAHPRPSASRGGSADSNPANSG